MTDPSSNISTVLKKNRFERGLTLEETAKLTGVSKAMIGQIERGESNPTISTLWKISAGLRIAFSDLIGTHDENYEAIKIDQLKPVYESDNKMILYDVFPFDPLSGFEYFYIKLLPGAKHTSPPHFNSTEEYLVVTSGTLVLTVADQEFILKAPEALKFKANVPHTYSNPYDDVVVLQSIIKY
ncbi:helix-turn-helix domain-containing protein [Fusibacter ferrireducens]|uniref:Helix-turn-helix transcriptional regulator n=1 Tax=Fusibacter ferrireducens TaxID=2785058 RepID=A0ABR9ZWL2_9FIRM|nr:XRE family transcriptional regulator [Fusibacter ferrireducens]MBF4694009.1 helix-turn-helix transcriptional regulator [Fusibacter ferrireducens]